MHDDADSESGRLMSERGGDGEQAPASAYRCRESAPSSRSPARFPSSVSHIDAGVPVRGGDHAQQTLEQLRVRQRENRASGFDDGFAQELRQPPTSPSAM